MVVWNLLLVAAYANGLLPQIAGADFSTLLEKVGAMVNADPTTLLLAVMGPVLLELWLLFDGREVASEHDKGAMA